jgi:hypothetical protein
MAKARRDVNGVYEELFCDCIEIPMKLVIDVTDEPDELKEEVAELLRKLVSEDEGERALAQEDLIMAFIAETPAACTMSYLTESAEAIEHLADIGALSAIPSDKIMTLASEARFMAERKAKKVKK